MPVRKATFADLRSIAEILAAAFYDEELNAYFFPHRQQYPEDYVQAWYQTVLEKWWDYDNVWIVSYIDVKQDAKSSSDESTGIQGQITGAAQWARAGVENGKPLDLQRKLDPRRYLVSLVALYLSTNRRIFPNRAVGQASPSDPKPLRKWEFGRAIWPFCKRYYTEPAGGRGSWQLDLLGVHPAQQKHGFGSELIAWGLREAREQQLPAVVIMGKGLEGFYHRQGFEILVGYATEDDLIVEEKDANGKIVQKTITNPLKQRGIGGGGIAWTKVESEQ